MKKLAILACVMTVSTGFAMAQQTVSIPFFADGEGFSCFVGLQNTGPGAIVVTVEYYSAGTGVVSGGTFGLAVNESVSFRPAFTGGGETPKGGSPSGFNFGSVTMTTSAGGSVAGRYVQFGGAGSFGHNAEIN